MAARDETMRVTDAGDAENPTAEVDKEIAELRKMLRMMVAVKTCIWVTAFILLALAIIVYWTLFFMRIYWEAFSAKMDPPPSAHDRDPIFLIIGIALSIMICLSFQMKDKQVFRLLVATVIIINCVVGVVALFVQTRAPIDIRCGSGCNSLWALSVFTGLLPGAACVILVAGTYYCTIKYRVGSF